MVIALYYRVQQVDALEKSVAELEEQVKLNSSTSSKLPSSDGPHHKSERPTKPKTGKKRGEQPVHKEHYHHRVPLEDDTEFVVYRPDTCQYCGNRLVG